MTTQAPGQATAVELCECGDEPLIGGFPKCHGCMTDEEAHALANHFNRQAIAVMRGRDRAVAIDGFHAAAQQADAALTAELGQAVNLEAAPSTATAAERKAQDRLRDANRYASRCAEDSRRAERDQASLEKQTAAIGKARDAAEVVGKAQAAHTSAVAAREAAETALGEHRKRAAVLEDAAVAARKQADNPPQVCRCANSPPSPATR